MKADHITAVLKDLHWLRIQESYVSLCSSVNIVWHHPTCRIWNITILRSPKQQIWLRTALCGGWCRRMALRNRELHARNDDDPTCPTNFNKLLEWSSDSVWDHRVRQHSIVPPSRSSLGDIVFLVTAVRMWNSLPSTVTAVSTLHSFRWALKTHLFTAFFLPS